jgi:hypothetical protein
VRDKKGKEEKKREKLLSSVKVYSSSICIQKCKEIRNFKSIQIILQKTEGKMNKKIKIERKVFYGAPFLSLACCVYFSVVETFFSFPLYFCGRKMEVV